MKNRLLPILTIAALLAGCTKDPLEQEAGRAALKVEVVTAEDSWNTRASVESPAEANIERSETIYLDDDVMLTAEVEDIASALVREQAEQALSALLTDSLGNSLLAANVPATRGTPATSPSQITSFMVNMYVDAGGFSAASSTVNTTFKGTLNGGAYTLSPSYIWLENSTDNHSFLVCSPEPSAANGIEVINNGMSVKYTPPTTVVNQPDLCRTANIDQVQKPSQTFAMEHALAAVGAAIKGYDVRIKTAKITGVAKTGTLSLIDGKWSEVSGTEDFTIGTNDTFRKDSHTAGYSSATNANGYLMMIPQTFTGNEKLEIVYEGNTSVTPAQSGGTIIVDLKTISPIGWEAGKRITYQIRLKTAPAVTSGDLTINDFRAGYTTSSPLTISAATDDNLTFTWSETWLKVHRGQAREGDTSGGAVSGWPTGVNGWGTTIWFFTTDNNTSTTAARTATVTVTGKKSGTKTFVVKQVAMPKPTISFSPAAPTTPVSGDGTSYTVKVTSNTAWTASGISNVTVKPTSGGTVGTTTTTDVVITVAANTSSTATRTLTATFATNSISGVTTASTQWKATQEALNYVVINGLKWAVGNLVATRSGGGQVGGPGDCKIGAPTDGGLYFQFGSLVGWGGGSDYSGRGPANSSLDARWAYVWPSGASTNWNSGWSGNPNSSTPSSGMGDACKYYLGGKWRLPTRGEYQALVDAGTGGWINNGGVNGRWFGKNPGNAATSVFFPASGLRTDSDGSFRDVTTSGFGRSSSLYITATVSYCLAFGTGNVYPQNLDYYLSYGFPVRCVSE